MVEQTHHAYANMAKQSGVSQSTPGGTISRANSLSPPAADRCLFLDALAGGMFASTALSIISFNTAEELSLLC